jgi:hypothetical protein
VEKIKLTPEQINEIEASKNPEELVAKLKGMGVEVTVEQVTAVPEKLSEGELENVAGGQTLYQEALDCYEKAKADGHPVKIKLSNKWKEVLYMSIGVSGPENEFDSGAYYCKGCSSANTTFARAKWDIKRGFDEYRDCICYKCGKDNGSINTQGIKVK